MSRDRVAGAVTETTPSRAMLSRELGQWMMRFLPFWIVEGIAQLVCLILLFYNVTSGGNLWIFLCFANPIFCFTCDLIMTFKILFTRSCGDCSSSKDALCCRHEIITNMIGLSLARAVFFAASIGALAAFGSAQTRSFIDTSILSDAFALAALVFSTVLTKLIWKKVGKMPFGVVHV